MCGISGFYSNSNQVYWLDQSLAAIAHRGPDSNGKQTWDEDGLSYVGLGHVRLSILDLSITGYQPMVSCDDKLVMVFNGEIYNHQELRRRLLGHIFVGHSDSEVLLEYYRRFGTSGLSDLRGMFTVAFYEAESRKLVLVRDQIGVKPLYYTQSDKGFFFSSEIRGLRPFLGSAPRVDRDALFEFMSCGFVYEPHTGFENILKLPAGSYAVVQDGTVSLHQFFDIEKESRHAAYSDQLVAQSIKRQLEADAKLGVFYSGGLDSSIIAAYAQKPSLFAQYKQNDVVLSGAENDEPYAEAIAERLKLDLRKVPLDADHSDAESVLKSMRAVAAGTEELISDYTYFASAELSKAARAEGFKVMLSGMGGDEVFVGYPRYRLLIGGALFLSLGNAAQWGWLRSILRRVPSIAKKVDRFAQFYSEKEFALRYARLLGYFRQQELRDLLGDTEYDSRAKRFVEKSDGFLKGFEGDPPVIRAMILDFYGFLSHNLMVADKSSMSVGLELRVPLLDQDLYCGYLGALRNGREPVVFGKQPLKKLLLSLLPRALVHRRKTGFNPPLDAKINMIGEMRILQILRLGFMASVLNLPAAEAIVRRHFANMENNSYKIWQLLYLSFWLDEHKPARV
jgi:asparagine synthase (glutamine-hydrolysing)